MIQVIVLLCLCVLITVGSQWLRNGARSRPDKTCHDLLCANPAAVQTIPDRPPGPQARAAAPAADVADCLCNQCEMSPACSLQYPECVGGHRSI